MATPWQTPGSAPPDPTAVIGRRIAAWVLDLVLFIGAVLVLFATTAEYLEVPAGISADAYCDLVQGSFPDDVATCASFDMGDEARIYVLSEADSALQTFVSVGWFALFVVVQGLAGGSPGKLIMGLRVVNAMGQRAGLGKSLLRTVLWVVDGVPYLLPLVGLITGVTTTGHRRVGDMAAGTYVVSRAAVGFPVLPVTAAPPPGQTAWGMPAPGTPPQPGGFGVPVSGPGWEPSSDGPPAPGTWAPPSATPAGPAGEDPSTPGHSPEPDSSSTPPAWTAPATPGTPPPAPVSEPPAWTPPTGPNAKPSTPPWTTPASTPPSIPESQPPTSQPPTSQPPTSQPPTWEPPAGPSSSPPATGEPASESGSGAAPAEPTPSAEPAERTIDRSGPVDGGGADAAGNSRSATESSGGGDAGGFQPLPPPQWDQARNTYIQWDPNRSAWLQWDEPGQRWKPIDT